MKKTSCPFPTPITPLLLILLSLSACVPAQPGPKAAARPLDTGMPCAFAWPSFRSETDIPIHEPVCRFIPPEPFIRSMVGSTVHVEVTRVDPTTGHLVFTFGSGVSVGSGTVLTAWHVVRDSRTVLVRVRELNADRVSYRVTARMGMSVVAHSSRWDAALLKPFIAAEARLLPPPLPVCRRLPFTGETLWHFGAYRTAWSVATVLHPTEVVWGKSVLAVKDTMVYYGDSGGPVVDDRGAVIGLVVRLSKIAPGVAYVTPIGPSLAALGFSGYDETCE